METVTEALAGLPDIPEATTPASDQVDNEACSAGDEVEDRVLVLTVSIRYRVDERGALARGTTRTLARKKA